MSKSSSELRRAFLEFFVRNGHQEVRSGPLVPANDPTLMFANAGMVQFKDVFTGREQRDYRRATSSQKCIRISGKHNDLEAVGPSPRHHTFFEMLGNFSFGDYFKEEAIVFAWDFLTKDLDLPKDRLICTYFKGEDGIGPDEFARDMWKKVTGFGDDRVRGLGKEDNFWAMGETGPCGPCSEIYFCQGPELRMDLFGEEQTPEGYGWMEIWNLVFMQFERSIGEGREAKMADLPAPCVDTGAGLERLASVLQDRTSNYETDLLRTLIDKAAALAEKPYRATMDPDDVSMRVIADHARTTAFLIAEGIVPDKTGRSYVLRRVMRRAIRHGHRLGIARPFLHEVALEVGAQMGEQYPELRERADLIASMTEAEEVRFRATIERGLGLLEEHFDRLQAENLTELDGRSVFTLYDTFGFPLDLTQVICSERGYEVDEPGFDAAMAEARQRSQFKGQEQAVEGVYREALGMLDAGRVTFTGYEREDDESKIAALIKDGELVDSAAEGDIIEVVTARTPLYGEQGGQLGDHGTIETDAGRLVVEDTQKPVDGLVVHRGKVVSGSLAVGVTVRLTVDVERRDAIRRAHSATHLMHWALRQTVGSHAQQKGSVVAPDRLRFDFTHTAPLTPEQLRRIEDLVNERTLLNVPVRTEELGMDEARKRGATMIFEEKYGDTVRMLTMAESVELCGGTHARATGDIGLFKILSEQGVAAGVRRIVATTGAGSLDHLRVLEQRLEAAARTAKASPVDLTEKLEKLIAHERTLEKQVDELQRKLLTGEGSGGLAALLGQARDLSGAKVLAVTTEVTDRAAMRELAEQLRDKLGDAIVLLASEKDDKAQLVIMVSKSLTGRFRAGDLIRPIAAIVGGSGGGRPDMAQAGGTDPSRLEEAVQALYAQVAAGPGA
jgi:alanyl-tRNA synthetase